MENLQTHTVVALVTKSIILTLSLDNLSPSDRLQKKVILSIAISSIITLSQSKGTQVSSTSTFLYSLICLQIALLGIANHLKLKFLHIMIFLLVNIIGFMYSIIKGYHKQLFQSTTHIIMLFLTSITFTTIWYLDNHYSESWSVTTRRKVFHLLPMLLLPILWKINYFFFTLMLAGSFYIFLQIQIIRFLSRSEFHFFQDFESLFPIIPWMEELNSQRQKYFWFTHLYLFLGFILPYIYYGENIEANIGLILAFGDAMAAIMGKKYGKTKIQSAAPKTYVGLCSFAVSVGFGQLLLGFNRSWSFIFLSSIGCGMVQVYSGILDNITVVLCYILLDIYF